MAYSHGFEWNDQGIARVQELIMLGNTSKRTADILTKEWGAFITKPMIDNIRQRFDLNKHLIEDDLSVIKFYDSDTLPMDNYMISCDDHSPYFSALYENRLLMIAEFFKIKKHIKVGDLVNQDYASHWPKMEAERRGSLDDDIAHSEPLFKALDYFDEIYLVRGNHEDRVTRITDARVQTKHILKLFGQKIHDKIQYTPYDKVFIGEEWMAVHPKSYSQISGSVAVRLAEKFHRHVLSAHGHFVSLRYDRSGKYMGIDLGGLFSVRKIPYCNLTTTSHPAWSNGFGMLRNGHFWHFHEGTDWGFWEKGILT